MASSDRVTSVASGARSCWVSAAAGRVRSSASIATTLTTSITASVSHGNPVASPNRLVKNVGAMMPAMVNEYWNAAR